MSSLPLRAAFPVGSARRSFLLFHAGRSSFHPLFFTPYLRPLFLLLVFSPQRASAITPSLCTFTYRNLLHNNLSAALRGVDRNANDYMETAVRLSEPGAGTPCLEHGSAAPKVVACSHRPRYRKRNKPADLLGRARGEVTFPLSSAVRRVKRYRCKSAIQEGGTRVPSIDGGTEVPCKDGRWRYRSAISEDGTFLKRTSGAADESAKRKMAVPKDHPKRWQ